MCAVLDWSLREGCPGGDLRDASRAVASGSFPSGAQGTEWFQDRVVELHHTFIAGDFNAHNRHWNCISTSGRCRSLHNLISHHQLSLHAPNTPTHIPRVRNANPSIVDFAISKNLTYPITTSVINALSFDHLPITFKIVLINPIAPPSSVAIYWKTFHNFLNNVDLTYPDINTNADISNEN